MARRHPHKVLTSRTVSAAAQPGRFADGGGLYLFVAPSGSKSWVLRTVVKGRRSDIGLGGVDLVSLADAREEARRLRRIARLGGDPLAERRQERRTVPTFEEAATEVHKAHSAAFKNDKHRKQWLASLHTIFTAFGAKRVDAVRSADILAAFSPTWLKRPETSRRVLQRIRVVFEWCKAQGFCSGDNPTQGITKVLPKQRAARGHHAALPYQVLPAFLQALRDSDSGEVVKLALEFTILCTSRTAETLNATWAEFDTEAKTWTIPATRMKAGAEHRVPLSARCVEILERAKGLSDGGTYVFPGRSPNKPLSNMVFLMALRRMKRTDLTTHGFRSTFRDWAAERTNVPRAVCEAALAHTLRDKTEAAYNRTDLFDRRRDLMASWARFATSKPADVVAIRA
ncbi:MAG TPA: integrase arm-type DNA-binding domain-containing protein [Vicinamibacterales bacterium]|nr:integrase arm-type DNA-binding domain-containing protein [Vicinamibacterales bacterium]